MRLFFRHRFVLALLLGGTPVGLAMGEDGIFDPPSGLYCSCPPTTPFGNSVIPEVAALDFVDGILVRAGWSLVEPSPGEYDWSRVDQQLEAAEANGKHVSLAIVNGPESPDWLAGLGAEMFDYSFHKQTRSMPVPWDAVYLERWADFIASFGEKYANDDRISLVYITHSSANGFEMQLPFSPPDIANWQEAGYNDALLVGAWMQTIEAFAEAFPRHYLSHDVHPVLGSNTVAEQVVAYTDEDGRYRGRVGVLAAWWMEHNAHDVYPGMYELLGNASYRSHSEVQVARSYTNTPGHFGPDGLAGALDLALLSGIRYAEVWNSDLLNPDLHPMLTDRGEQLRRPFCDLNADGSVDVDDLYATYPEVPDLNADGQADDLDRAIVRRRLRARGIEDCLTQSGK